MRRRALLATTAWVAAAIVATLIGIGAVRLIGESIAGTPGGVLSRQEVDRELAKAPATAPPASSTVPPAAPSSGAAPAPLASSAGSRRVLAATGGSVIAECVGTAVRLLSWAPAQGYRVHDAEPGPDDEVEVDFRGPAGRAEVKVRCVAGQPVADADVDD